MKHLLPILLMTAAAVGAADVPAPYSVRISSSDGDWTLVFPQKPVESPVSELKMRTGHVCIEKRYELDVEKVSLLTVTHLECPGYEIPPHERQAFYDRMVPDVEQMSANRPGETTSRTLEAGKFAGQEVRKKYAILELGLRTYVGKNSVLRLTAMWKPANIAGAAAAERFLEPR